MYTDKNH